MTVTRRGFLWAVAALLGIAVTAALTWSVSRLAGQHIGLSTVPPSVISGLAPQRADPRARAVTPAVTPARRTAPAPTTAAPSPASPASPATPVAPTTTAAAPAATGTTGGSLGATSASHAAPRSGSGSGDVHDDSGGGPSSAAGSGSGGRSAGSQRDD